MTNAVETRELTKHYVLKGETVRALRGVTFDVPTGDYVAIMIRDLGLALAMGCEPYDIMAAQMGKIG